MNSLLVRLALPAVILLMTSNAAFAVTWFDSNIRPDGAFETNAEVTGSAAPLEDGAQVVSAGNNENEAPTLEGVPVYHPD